MDTPTKSGRFDLDTLAEPVTASQIHDTESLIDLDDGTTNSYHTARDSRLDNGRQSTLSIASNETTSTLHQTMVHDEHEMNIASPEDGFYYDALASPIQANQQITSAIEKQNVLIDNLTNLLQQIETFNRTTKPISTAISEENLRQSPDGIESNPDINRLTNIVSEIHQINQTNTSSAMDNLLFVYEEFEDEPLPSSNDNIQPTACVDNLVFYYDDIITPTDEVNPAANVSNEWSYDNLTAEQVDTDHLGTIVHEALAARFQKPIKMRETIEEQEQSMMASQDKEEESPGDTDNLGSIVHEALAARSQKPIRFKQVDEMQEEESPVSTDNLGTIIHEALAARFQKPIRFKEIDQVNTDVPTEEIEQTMKDDLEESPVDTDNLGSIVHEALAARFQKPIRFKEIPEVHEEEEEQSTASFDQQEEESPVHTDNLGRIVHEALAARFQVPIKFKRTIEVIEEEDPTIKFEETSSTNLSESTPIDSFDTEAQREEFAESSDEPTDETGYLGMIIHEALTTNFQKPIKTDQWVPYVYQEEYLEPIDESSSSTDNLAAIIHEALVSQSRKGMKSKSKVTFEEDILPKESPDSIDAEIIPPTSELSDDIYRSETITYEIESVSAQTEIPVTHLEPPPPVSNLSRIVSDSLLASSNYHRSSRDEQGMASTVSQQAPIYDEEIYEEYGYRRTTTDPESEDIIDKYEELCHRYTSAFDQYTETTKKFDDEINAFEKQVHEQALTPNSETVSEELVTTIECLVDPSNETKDETEETYSTIIVKRQPDNVGKYGFNLDESSDGKVQISSILDENYCPNLHSGDEIIGINNNRTFKTPEQCQLIFDSLWKNSCEDLQITIIQSPNIPNIPSKYRINL